MITILAWPALFVAIHLLERWPQMSSRRSVMVGFIVFHHFFLFFFCGIHEHRVCESSWKNKCPRAALSWWVSFCFIIFI
jgi:hypothetical protein